MRGRGTDGVGRGGFAGAFFHTGALAAVRAGKATPGSVLALVALVAFVALASLGSPCGAASTIVRSLSTANGSGFRAITIVGSSPSIETAALFA